MRVLLAFLAACTSANSAPSPTVTIPPTPATSEIKKPSAPVLVGDPAVTTRVTSVFLAARVDDGSATDRPTYARMDQRVTLHAVVVAGGKLFTDAPSLRLGNKRVTTSPLAQAPRVELRWNRIEPATNDISNGALPEDFHFHPIDYRATPITLATGGSLTADVRPTLTPDHGGGLGTMRFQLVAIQGDRVIASPGPEARRGKGSGGLGDAVLRVSIRRDDTFLGYLTEMYNQPYIWASAGLSDSSHQSEHLEGSDCADFLIYGQRRMGIKHPYTWTGGLPKITKLLAAGTRDTAGIYRDAKGNTLPFTQVGDLVLFPRHVGALAVDRGELGVLDDQDLMMHTLFDSPKEQAIADSGYADKPVELRRFRNR